MGDNAQAGLPGVEAMTMGSSDLSRTHGRFRDLVSAFYAEVSGRLELRVLRPGGRGLVARGFLNPSENDAIATFCRRHRDADLYFGVALRGEADSGTAQNCVCLTALFCDIDFKDLPEAEARERLAACPIQPSVIIASGGGLHAYWLLTEPITLPGEANVATGVLRRLAGYLGGDLASAEPARVLRVPGGLNHKYAPARRVTIEALDSSRRYNLGDFDWLPTESAAVTSSTDTTTEIFPSGQRNTRLHAIGRSLHARGATAEAILDALRSINSRQCAPPLPDGELGALVAQVTRQANRADFTGPIDTVARPKVNGTRSVTLTAASLLTARPVKWLWQDRIALGTFSLVGGREGIGKSIVTCWLTAEITRGTLPGAFEGRPRAVIIAATEDSWEHTIVPRLMAARADLKRVFRADVATTQGNETALSLPRDLPGLERAVIDSETVLVLLDPLMSRLDAHLDTHKDAEVRLALEPLTALANTTNAAVLGLIHQNKTAAADVLTSLMGSRAFAAVARSVLVAMVDPENEKARLLGQVKNNLGRVDLPTLQFQIVGARVANTPEGDVWTGQLQWTGETDRTIKDATETAAASTGDRSATAEAADWLADFLKSEGGSALSANIKREGSQAGHSAAALKRARHSLRVITSGRGYPRQTWWTLSSRLSSGETHRERVPTEPTEGNARRSQSAHYPGLDRLTPSVGPVGSVGSGPPRDEPTEALPAFVTDDTEPTEADLADPIGQREEVLCRKH